MKRTDRQPDQQLVQRIAADRTMLDDLRTAQTFGGSDVRLYRLARSDGQPDITLTNLTSSASQGIAITVTPNAGNPVSLPTPLLDLGFTAAPTPSGLGSYYSLTRLPPTSGGAQTIYIYLLAGSTTISSLAIVVNIWAFVPSTYTVTHL